MSDIIRDRWCVAGRLARSRAAFAVAIIACALVLGLALDDGFRGEPATIERQQRSEVPAPVAQPAPAPPIAPVPVTAEGPEVAEPTGKTTAPRATQRRAAAQRKRIEAPRRTRRTGPAPPRWTNEPLGGEPPAWGAP
jgi:hypothetical protein